MGPTGQGNESFVGDWHLKNNLIRKCRKSAKMRQEKYIGG
jgi:hypothetical protein